MLPFSLVIKICAQFLRFVFYRMCRPKVNLVKIISHLITWSVRVIDKKCCAADTINKHPTLGNWCDLTKVRGQVRSSRGICRFTMLAKWSLLVFHLNIRYEHRYYQHHYSKCLMVLLKVSLSLNKFKINCTIMF